MGGVMNDRSCGIVALRQSSGNGKFWPIPVLHQKLIKEFAN